MAVAYMSCSISVSYDALQLALFLQHFQLSVCGMQGLDYINRKKNVFLISAIEKDPPRVYVDIITDQDLE